MKRIYAIMTVLALCGWNTTQAQNVETEITVTDKGKEEVIELPQGMITEVDSLLHLYNTKTYMKPATDCNVPNVNPIYTKEEYMERLKRIPSVIEMPYNDIVQKFIDRYSSRLRRSVSYMLGAQNFYMPIFEQALETYGLPLELKYLPVIESALNPKAVSRVGATGLWQFMLKTGKSYGLEINSLVDERRDPIKSSWAAARYLRDLYKIYGDWNLVIAAYNCGPTKINKAIHRADGVRDYWTIYPYLPQETRGYVPAFIAANYIMTYYCEHNICPMKTKIPVTTDTIMVSRNVHMEQISALCGIDVEAIRALNPQYRTSVIPGQTEPCAIRLPQEKILAFIDQKDSIYNYRADELLTRRAVVAVSEPKAEPTRSTASQSRSTAARHKRNRKSTERSATVRKGDSLSTIAARNHTTVAKIRKLNKIKGNMIKPGQKIRVK